MVYEFGSPGWMAFMHGMVAGRIADLGEPARDVNFSICEVFTDPPPTLSPTGAPLAWHCIVRGGEVEFGAFDRQDVEVRVVADYAAILPLARYDHARGDPVRATEIAAQGQALRESGKLVVHGNRAQRDPRIGNLHDPIARVTA
jgi:hypothetical protein